MAFALRGPTLGQAGRGCAEFGGHVISIPDPQWVSFPLSSLPVSVPGSFGLQGGVVEDQKGCVWPGLACVLLQLTYLNQLSGRSQVTVMQQSLLRQSSSLRSQNCYKLSCGRVMRNS